MSTLSGGFDLEVKYQTGEAGTVKVRQLPLREYESAFPKFDNEMAITAIICGKTIDWIYSLTPESYEDLRVKAREVNEKGFFAFAERQKKSMMESLNLLKPELIQQAASQVSGSMSSQPGLRPMRG